MAVRILAFSCVIEDRTLRRTLTEKGRRASFQILLNSGKERSTNVRQRFSFINSLLAASVTRSILNPNLQLNRKYIFKCSNGIQPSALSIMNRLEPAREYIRASTRSRPQACLVYNGASFGTPGVPGGASVKKIYHGFSICF